MYCFTIIIAQCKSNILITFLKKICCFLSFVAVNAINSLKRIKKSLYLKVNVLTMKENILLKVNNYYFKFNFI